MTRLQEALRLDARDRTRLERLLVLAALILAAFLVADAWTRVADEPLSPDAWNFRDLARRDLHHPYDTGYREPLHCWVIGLLLALGGTSDKALRGVGVLIYAVSLGIYYTTTRRLFGRGLAAVCLFLYALSPKNAALSVEGVRNFEVVAALALVAFTGRRVVERARELGPHVQVGLAAALASLTYLSLFLVTQIWLWVTFALERFPGRKRHALALAIPVVLVLPHLWNSERESGDLFDTLDRHARFYRNLEYRGRPGFPTVAEVESDAYCGPRTTGLRYVFEGRSVGEVAGITARGLFLWGSSRSPAYESYRNDTVKHFGIPIWAACVVGASLILARNRRFLWVLTLVGAAGLPFWFLLGVHQLDGRLLNDYLFAWLWLLAGFIPPTPKRAT